MESSEPALSPEEVDDIVRAARGLLFKHPVAAQAAFSALVKEGRRFAQTDEGAVLKETLAFAPSALRLRTIWEIGSLNVLRERPTQLMPSAIIEAIAQLATERQLEERLSFVFESLEKRTKKRASESDD